MAADKKPGTKPATDRMSGVETTGHVWDGIRELNNPSPRWWLWIFFLTIIWGIGYAVVYPSWPTLSGRGERGGTVGTFGWTQYSELAEQQAEIIARRERVGGRFGASSFDEILNDPELYAFALAGGKSAFKDNCATCHGTGGAGAKGFPNLNDDDWLWGGSIEAIHQTINYGIRSGDDARFSQMPAFGDSLSDEEIESVAAYVYSLGHDASGIGASVLEAGQGIFAEQCAVCHGENARGLAELGAPNLADTLWLYSEGEVADIARQIANPTHGVMPGWNGRLSEDTIRQLTIYVHSLGGGE